MESLLTFSHAPAEGRRLAKQLQQLRPLFVCTIASTETARIPGISAAGASAELIPYTAAADAEVLCHGSARCIPGVPSNPLGPPGPALITLAALQLASIPHLIVNAGCQINPDADYVHLGGRPGRLITQGNAVPNADALFAAGRELGATLAREHDYLVLAESVPGGTTTALALLLALGLDADGRVSSSMAENSHELKSHTARQALKHIDPASMLRQPLNAVAVLGDPMQAAVAGLASGALATETPILLAGGTQMIAVLALLVRLSELGLAPNPAGKIAVATTRWVVEDPTADATGLITQLGPFPLIATPLSFASSRFQPLRLYEQHLVKEGVGAGGAAIAAALAANVTPLQILDRVEAIYERMSPPEHDPHEQP